MGYLWLSTHHGLQRIAKAELNRCADGAISVLTSQIYDQHDGLPTIEFTGGLQAAACKTKDGRLWFTSSKGLVSVDPSRIEPNPRPIEVWDERAVWPLALEVRADAAGATGMLAEICVEQGRTVPVATVLGVIR